MSLNQSVQSSVTLCCESESVGPVVSDCVVSLNQSVQSSVTLSCESESVGPVVSDSEL